MVCMTMADGHLDKDSEKEKTTNHKKMGAKQEPAFFSQLAFIVHH